MTNSSLTQNQLDMLMKYAVGIGSEGPKAGVTIDVRGSLFDA